MWVGRMQAAAALANVCSKNAVNLDAAREAGEVPAQPSADRTE